MGSPIRGGSPVRDSYDVAQRLGEGEKGKEEEDSAIDLQSEPSPLIHQLPEELLVRIFNFTAGSDQLGAAKTLCAIRRVCTLWYRLSDDVLLMYWNKLRNGQVPPLYSFANAIEERIGNFEFSYFFRFHVLTEEFRRIGASIPDEDPETAIQPVLGLQPLQYVQVHQVLDAALAKIAPSILKRIHVAGDPIFVESGEVFLQWLNDPLRVERERAAALDPANAKRAAAFAERTPRMLKQIYVPGDPVLIGAKAFRQWLNHPANADRIAQITALDLARLELRILPPEIGKFTQLRSLYLNKNQLTSLPDTIGALTQLRELYLHDNQLTGLPDTISALTQLGWLRLNNNQFTNFPDVIVKLTQMKELYLYDNQLTSLPDIISKLTQLQKFYLHDNHLTSLPDTIGRLTQLDGLSLYNNQLTSLPDTIDRLIQLRQFILSGNPVMFMFDKELKARSSLEEISNDLRERTHEAKREFVRGEIAKHAAWLNYSCQSPLAALCQGIHRGVDNEALREQFGALSSQMQQQIRNKWAATPSSSSSSSEAGDELFADRAVFAKAVISALREKFNGLSEKQKKLTYRRVAKLAGRPAPNSRWGKAHAEDNIIRLIDAMELVTNS